MLKLKKYIRIIICIVFLLGVLVFIDNKTTYIMEINPNNVEVINEDIIIEMSSGTSTGLFRSAKLKEIDSGIYSIEAYFSLLTGEYSGYKYKINNSDKHIKEIRQYHLDGSKDYTIIYQTN